METFSDLSLTDARYYLGQLLDRQETRANWLDLWLEIEGLKDYIDALENAQNLD